jgi:hypothetical protein
MVVLEPEPGVWLVALFLPGLWLRVETSSEGTRASWVLGKKTLGPARVGRS